jgi:hypothetical protein
MTCRPELSLLHTSSMAEMGQKQTFFGDLRDVRFTHQQKSAERIGMSVKRQ